MADLIKGNLETLRKDLVTLNRAMRTLAKKLPEEDAKTMPRDYTSDEALGEAIAYGGYFARHLKEASRGLREEERPTSISVQVSGVAITWDISV